MGTIAAKLGRAIQTKEDIQGVIAATRSRAGLAAMPDSAPYREFPVYLAEAVDAAGQAGTPVSVTGSIVSWQAGKDYGISRASDGAERTVTARAAAEDLQEILGSWADGSALTIQLLGLPSWRPASRSRRPPGPEPRRSP